MPGALPSAQSPFLKIRGEQFTEVGYVGRDVESMIRDLTVTVGRAWCANEEDATAVKIIGLKRLRRKNCSIFCFLPRKRQRRPKFREHPFPDEETGVIAAKEEAEQADSTREKLRKLLRQRALRDRVMSNSKYRTAISHDRNLCRGRHG